MDTNQTANEDWPLLDNSNQQPAPSSTILAKASTSSNNKNEALNLKKMPRDVLRRALLNECALERKFLQSLGNVSNKPLYQPSEIATQYLAMNDLKRLKKVVCKCVK